jgi:DNA-binding XRE family transcriptional regulator
MAEDALNLWREKLEFFQRELAVTADASRKTK